jgi:hypothetical protein
MPIVTSAVTIEWIKIAPQEMERAQERIAKCTQLKLVRVPEPEGEPSVIDLWRDFDGGQRWISHLNGTNPALHIL